jgi:hypothetical protein
MVNNIINVLGLKLILVYMQYVNILNNVCNIKKLYLSVKYLSEIKTKLIYVINLNNNKYSIFWF